LLDCAFAARDERPAADEPSRSFVQEAPRRKLTWVVRSAIAVLTDHLGSVEWRNRALGIPIVSKRSLRAATQRALGLNGGRGLFT
jgi:hypothetical protein